MVQGKYFSDMIRITFIFLLLSFDAFSCIKGLKPHVSRAYRDYYILHSITSDAYLNATRAELSKVKP